MDYYHDLITEKSFAALKQLQKKIDFVLIGGWAVYFYAHTLKSKDIDILINYDQLPLLAKHYQTEKNDRLHKYESRRDEIQIDIYLPHYSRLGIPVAHLIHQTTSLAGFTLLDANYLFVLKLYTLKSRAHSIKGHKDFLDLISLSLSGSINLPQIQTLINQYCLRSVWENFNQIVTVTTQIPDLNLNSYQTAKLKRALILK